VSFSAVLALAAEIQSKNTINPITIFLMFVLLLILLQLAKKDEILSYITFIAIYLTEKKRKRKEKFCCGV
jgi:hypothetical protein